MELPEPTPHAREHSNRVAEHIRGEITASGGWISFARYTEHALYAPGLGYYSAGARKLGKAGDFVTAPEISPLYGQTLARQVKQVLEAGVDEGLEVGAGSGALAATLLEELGRSGRVPRNHLILELSADLRERRRDTLAAGGPHLLGRLARLNRLAPKGVLPSSAKGWDAHVPLPPPRARRSVLPPWTAGHHQPRRFQRNCRGRARGRAGSRRLHQSGAVPRQLRYYRGDVAHAGGGRREVPSPRQPGEPPDEPGGNGGALQGDRARAGIPRAARGLRRRRQAGRAVRCKLSKQGGAGPRGGSDGSCAGAMGQDPSADRPHRPLDQRVRHPCHCCERLAHLQFVAPFSL